MPAPDIRTILLLCGLLFVCLPVGAWLVSNSRREPAHVAWFGGNMLIGFGLVLRSMLSLAPTWLARDCAGVLVAGGLMLLLCSMGHQLGRPLNARACLAGFTVYVVSFFLALASGDLLLALQVSLLMYFVQISLLVARLLQLGRQESLRSCRWLAITYTGLLIGISVRFASLTLGLSPVASVHTPGNLAFDVVLALVFSVFAAVVGNVGYLGLELERAARRAAEHAARQARQEYNAGLLAQITHLERQRSLGEMAATLAHEVKQPLTAILSNAQLAQRMVKGRADDSDALKDTLSRVVNNTRHATEIIDRVRGYVRPTSLHKQHADMGGIVRDVMDLLAGEARREGVRIQLDDTPDAGVVLGDPVQISQVLLNVLRNAMQALRGAPVRDILVTVRKHAGSVIVEVRDTGPGLSEEVLAKAGTPFFTTRPDGMGVGLSISSTIAAQHGGRLGVFNAAGGGALAVLELPEADTEPAPPAARPALGDLVAAAT